jgi:hypothetical protein
MAKKKTKKEESSRYDVYEYLFQIGTASELHEPWQNVAGDGSLFDLRIAEDKLLKRLRERFEDEVLKSAGVVNVDSEGRVTLAPTLARDRSYILAVKAPDDGKPVDLIFATGETLSGASGFTTSLTDFGNNCRIREGRRLFVTAAAEDSAVLRFLGVPVVPLRAFERFGKVEIEQLQALLRKGVLPYPPQYPDLAHAREVRVSATETVAEHDISMESTDPNNETAEEHDEFMESTDPNNNEFDSEDSRAFVEPVRLVFVNWSLAGLDYADVPAVMRTASQLQTLDRELKLQLPLYNILVWKASLEWVTRVVQRLAYGFERDIVSDLADIDADCKWLCPGASHFHAAKTRTLLRGPRAAAAAEWRDGS